MAKDYSRKFYNSKAWKDCRASYISKVYGLCEHCLENDKHVPGYIVDHIIELTPENINDPEITLSHENLQYLCTSCHSIKTFTKYEVIRDGLMFDLDGNIVEKMI